MDCRRRSAVDDDRSRIRWTVDEDRRRRRWAVDKDRRRRRWAVDDDRRRTRWAVDDEEDYPPLQLPLQWRDPPPHYPPLELPLKWRNPLPDHLVRNQPAAFVRSSAPVRPHSVAHDSASAADCDLRVCTRLSSPERPASAAASGVPSSLDLIRSRSRRPDVDNIPDLNTLSDIKLIRLARSPPLPHNLATLADDSSPPDHTVHNHHTTVVHDSSLPSPSLPSSANILLPCIQSSDPSSEPTPLPSLQLPFRFRDSLPETTADATPPSLLAPNPVIPASSFCFPLSSCEPKLTPMSVRTALPPSLPPMLSFHNPTLDLAFEYTEPLLSFPYASPTTHGEISMAMLKSGSSISINQEMSENGDEDEGKDFRWSRDPGGTTMPICRVTATSLGGATISLPRKWDESLIKQTTAAKCVTRGSFYDSNKVQGLAQFLELIHFMGSSEFSDKNEYDSYLSQHRGYYSAYTKTYYQFKINHEFLKRALNKFSQLSVTPLVKLQLWKKISFWENKKSLVDAMENRDKLQEEILLMYRRHYLKDILKLVFAAFGLNVDSLVQKSARKLFDEMPQRVAISWNAMVQVPVKNIFSELGISPLVHIMDTGSSKVKEDSAKNFGNFCNYSKDIRACVQTSDDVPALLWLLKNLLSVFKIFDPGGLLMFSTLTSPPMKRLDEVEFF